MIYARQLRNFHVCSEEAIQQALNRNQEDLPEPTRLVTVYAINPSVTVAVFESIPKVATQSVLSEMLAHEAQQR